MYNDKSDKTLAIYYIFLINQENITTPKTHISSLIALLTLILNDQ